MVRRNKVIRNDLGQVQLNSVSRLEEAGFGAHSGRIAPIVARLRQGDEEIRETAADELDALAREGLTAAEGLEVLTLAAERFPSRRFTIQDTAADLVRAAGVHPRLEYVPLVQKLFRRYNAKARLATFELLARLEDRSAAEAFVAIVRSNARANRVRSLPTHLLVEQPRFPEVFFPELFDFLDVPDLTWPICELCLGWIDRGALSGADVAHHVGPLLKVYAPRRDRLLELEEIGRFREDEYGLLRREAGLLLDLLGHLPTPAVQAELRRALSFRDVRLRYFAASALLRLGRTVPEGVIAEIAQTPEMRGWLWEELDRQHRTWMYPKAWCTTEAFAEAHLVRWLAFPAELGRVPDEMELMDVVSIEPLADVKLDWYVFRFRLGEPHWAAKDGWLAGVAGPYLHGAEPGTSALGDAFSRFEPFSRRTSVGHVGDPDRLALEWKERWQQGRLPS